MTRARVTVTALRARTRRPWNRRSPSTVVSSTTRKTARLRSQYSMKPSTTATAVSQLASSDQSPSTRPASTPDPFDQLLGQHGDGRLHVLEVLVEGGRRRAGLAGDVDHLDRAPRRGHQQLGGALQQPLAGGQAPMAGDPAVGGGDQLRIVGIGRHGGPWYRRRDRSMTGRQDRWRRPGLHRAGAIRGRLDSRGRNPWRVG